MTLKPIADFASFGRIVCFRHARELTHRIASIGRTVSVLLIAAAWSTAATPQQLNALTAGDPEPTTSDAFALATIFSEQHVPQSGLWVRRRTADLNAEQRYAFLRDWVLPGTSHQGFRVTIDFLSDSHPQSSPDGQPQWVSPALDLIDAAILNQKPDALQRLIETAPTESPKEQCEQLALQCLLAMRLPNLSRASDLLDEFFTRVLADESLLDQARPAILLCVDQAARTPQLAELAREPVAMITQHYRGDYDRTAWHRHLWAVQAKLIDQTMEDEERINTRYQSSQWFPASLETAYVHGSGFPRATWQFRPGSVRKLSSYNDDFLFFVSPLQGNFSVEGDATGFGYREAHLLNAGRWIGLVFDHKQFRVGNLRGELSRSPIDSAMTDTHEQGVIHTRVENRDGTATTFFNGRRIDVRETESSPYPWLGIRSNRRNHGGFEDLRITGAAEIPHTLSLVESPQLLGWYDYYQPPIDRPDRLSDWSVKLERNGAGSFVPEIHDSRHTELLRGSNAEHLLVYMRPMIEDGFIEYDFWYANEKFAAHPALGRTCFLLTPNGVQHHRITDGRYERSSLRPDNNTVSDTQNLGPMPFHENDWNRMRVERRGRTINFTLNGTLIHSIELNAETGVPKFGLFHFADRTALRVRDPQWTGDWPKQLPSVEAQELTGKDRERLVWRSDVPAEEMVHRFDSRSVESGGFVITLGNPEQTVQATNAGLVIRQQSDASYRGALVSPTLTVGGDFDVTVDYDTFNYKVEPGKIASVRMELLADTVNADLVLIQRLMDRSERQVVQCLRMRTIEGIERRRYFGRVIVDAPAGRLRLSRRGDQVFYLVADFGSDHFRLVGEESFVSDDLEALGIKIGVQAQGPAAFSSARFKRFEVRAERLGGLAAIDPQTIFAELGQHRTELPESLLHDFSAAAPSQETFYRWADTAAWNASDKGLRLRSTGADDWTSAGMSISHSFAGDFDMKFDFDPISMATPKAGKDTQVFLQIELDDEDSTQLSSIYTKSESGSLLCQCQVRLKNGGEYKYVTLGKQPLDDPDYLRVQRRGTEVFFLAGCNAPEQEFLIGTCEATRAPTKRYGVRVLLHTGGAGRSSEILAKSVHIRSEQTQLFSRPHTVAPMALPASEQPSFPSRVLQSLRSIFE